MDYKIGRILVGVAGSSDKVLAAAAAIARKCQAEIEMVSVVRPTSPSPLYGLSAAESAKWARASAGARRMALERLAKPLRAAGIAVRCQVELNAGVTDGLLDRIAQYKPQLVAIEAHKHRAIARLLLSQTDYSLIRHCPVPLLIVKNSDRVRRTAVMAALDPRQTNDKPASLDSRIMTAAQGFADILGGALHGVHVYAPLVGYLGDPVFAPVAVPVSAPEEKAYAARVRKNFRKFCAQYAIKPRNVHLKMGDPTHVLPTLARTTKARMVVMGAVPRGRITRALIGNTAERVLDAMPCDILVVKPDWGGRTGPRSGN